MVRTQRSVVNSSTDSCCDEMFILIDRLSIKISTKCVKRRPSDVLMSNQEPTVIRRSIGTWADCLCWPWRLDCGGLGQRQTLHSILIITMHHQQIALTKRSPFSGTLSEMRNTLSLRLSAGRSLIEFDLLADC